LFEKPEGKRPFGRLKRRWKNNFKINLRGRGWEFVSWINLDQDTDRPCVFVNMVMSILVP
jgi:hypothetical protein